MLASQGHRRLGPGCSTILVGRRIRFSTLRWGDPELFRMQKNRPESSGRRLIHHDIFRWSTLARFFLRQLVHDEEKYSTPDRSDDTPDRVPVVTKDSEPRANHCKNHVRHGLEPIPVPPKGGRESVQAKHDCEERETC